MFLMEKQKMECLGPILFSILQCIVVDAFMGASGFVLYKFNHNCGISIYFCCTICISNNCKLPNNL